MSFRRKTANFIHRWTNRLLEPKLLRLRLQGGLDQTYIELDRPWLRNLGIATILDIGANTGQFLVTAKALFPDARVYCFEPLPDCYEQLQRQAAGLPNCECFNVALGDIPGSLSIHRSDFTPSSSFLEMAEVHRVNFPETQNSRPVEVQVQRLDDIASSLVIQEPILLKIDVQGFEDRVLAGGEQTVRRSTLLILETSFEQLYEGQPLFDDIYRQLVSWGFRFLGSLDQLSSPQDGRPLQIDSLFIRR